MKQKQIHEEERTTQETRNLHAAFWQEDWYKVLEDMQHCAQFILRDELADLFADGLGILGDSLTESEKREWERITEAVKGVVIDHAMTTQRSIRDLPRIQHALMDHCEDMVRLLDRIDRLSP